MARERKREIVFVGRERNGPTSVLGAAFPGNHEGYSGYTIAPCAAREGIAPLVPSALSAGRPHVVLLMIGTNDVGAGCDLPSMPSRLGALVDTITTATPEAWLFVASLVPSQDEGFDARAKAYNDALPRLVAERVAKGRRVAFVDMLAAFRATPEFRTKLLADMLHPNDAGYAVMAETWATVVFPKRP